MLGVIFPRKNEMQCRENEPYINRHWNNWLHSGTWWLGSFVTALVPSKRRWSRHASATWTKTHESCPSKKVYSEKYNLCSPCRIRVSKNDKKNMYFHHIFVSLYRVPISAIFCIQRNQSECPEPYAKRVIGLDYSRNIKRPRDMIHMRRKILYHKRISVIHLLQI